MERKFYLFKVSITLLVKKFTNPTKEAIIEANVCITGQVRML